MSVPFVGRDAELQTLRALISEARRAGAPAVALVVGEPGSGKSRLLRETLAHIDPRRSITLAGFELAEAIPFLAAGDLIRRLVAVPVHGPNLEALVFGAADMQGQGSYPLFEAAHRAQVAFGPLVVAVDDLQWLDPQSLALLHYLVSAAETSRSPLAVLAVARPSSAASAFASALAGSLSEDRHASLELRGLALRDGVALVHAIDAALDDRAAEDLWRRAEGSPFWLDALARAHGTVDLVDLLNQRLRGLSVDAGALLNCLVIGGRPFASSELSSVLQWEAGQLDHALRELIARGVAIEAQGEVRPSHDLFRETALRSISATAARRLHTRFADYLEGVAQDDVQSLAEALDHRAAAGQSTVELAVRLVRSPARALVGDETLARLSAIAENVAAGSAGQLELDEGLGRLAVDLAKHDIAVRHWARVAATAPDLPTRQRAELEAARAGWDTLPPEKVHEHLARARAMPLDPVMEMELDTVDALVRIEVEYDMPGSLAVAEHAVSVARELAAGVRPLESLAAETRHAILDALSAAAEAELENERTAEALSLSEEVLELSTGLGSEAELKAALFAGWVSVMVGRLPEADARFRRALALADQLIRPRATYEASMRLSRVLFALGRLAEARSFARQAYALQARLRPWIWGEIALAILAIIDLAAGERDALRDLDAVAPGLDVHFSIEMHQQAAIWLARRDGRERAGDVERELAAARSAVAAVACPNCSRELQIVAVELLARIGRVAEAELELKAWENKLRDASHPMRELWLNRARAAVAIARRSPDAAAMLAELAAAYDREGLHQDAAWAWLDLGNVQRDAGVRDAAVAAYSRAAGIAQEIGASGLERLVNRALRDIGVRAWRRAGAKSGQEPLAGLTDREREVARLVGEGATNLEVAASLAISAKTVERHLTNILAKVAARNRTELAALLHAGSVPK